MLRYKDKILFSLLIFFIIAFSFFLIVEILNLDKIALGIAVADLKIGGLTTDETKNILQERFADWENHDITLIFRGQKFFAEPAEMGIFLNLDKTVSQAYNFGRDKNILIGLSKQISVILPLSKTEISPAYSFDKKQFQQFAEEKFALFETPAINASLVYDAKSREWKTTPAKSGQIFNREKLIKDLESSIANLDSSAIELALVEDQLEVLENETEQAKNQAENILNNAPYFLKYNDQSWKVDRETLLDWIEFTTVEDNAKRTPPPLLPLSKGGLNKILGISLNQEKIKDVLTAIAPSINQEPINAQLTIQDGKVNAFVLSQEGIRLDVEKSASKIDEKILAWSDSRKAVTNSGNNNALTGAIPNKKIELVTKKNPPTVSTENIDTLGLTSLLGKGESNFIGSPKNRMHNIKTGAAKFNGILLTPNEEFSFNKLLGEIGPNQGYLPELVIKQNKTIPEYGGGLCQVSTTAFRAAVNAGLKITERYPHAFPVKYYNPQGFDATIYPSHPDLKFINDTPKYILIQTKIQGTKIIFEFYGTADGREVKVKGPTVLSSNSDGSMKTILYQEIWRNGQMKRQDKFFSSYKSPDLYPVERNPLE